MVQQRFLDVGNAVRRRTAFSFFIAVVRGSFRTRPVAAALLPPLFALLAGAAVAADWARPPGASLDADLIWVYLDHPVSVDCSPPRACYAKSQWVLASVRCHRRLVSVARIVSMDLHGDVVNDVSFDTSQPPRIDPFMARNDTRTAGRQVLDAVCGQYYERD